MTRGTKEQSGTRTGTKGGQIKLICDFLINYESLVILLEALKLKRECLSHLYLCQGSGQLGETAEGVGYRRREGSKRGKDY